jgi:hypothetical protein
MNTILNLSTLIKFVFIAISSQCAMVDSVQHNAVWYHNGRQNVDMYIVHKGRRVWAFPPPPVVNRLVTLGPTGQIHVACMDPRAR